MNNDYNNNFNNYPYPQPPQAPQQAPQPPQAPQQAPQPPQAPQQAPQPPQAPQMNNGYTPQPQPAEVHQTQAPAQPNPAPQPPYYQYPQQQYRQPYQPQKQPLSSGMKAFIAIMITFLVLLLTGFIIFVATSNSGNGFVESTTQPETSFSFTMPTEETTEAPSDGREYPESNAQNATDPSYKGLATQNKPKKINANEYGSAYAFEKNEKSVVAVICYGEGQEGNEKSYQSMGSGIVISKDGFIITNSHIIGHSRTAYKLKIVTSDKKEYKAGVVGYDSRNDIAVLKADANNLTPAQFGNSDELKVTEDIVVIGNPLGMNYQNSVTKGIISALDREVLSSNIAKVIQTDAAINPGNSGGPMVNMYGQVVGVATAKIVLEEYEGMAFAIPGNTVKKIVDSIIREGYIKGRVKIGIVGQVVMLDEKGKTGIEIDEIVKGGPVDGKDVQTGDVLTKVEGKEISSFRDVYQILETHKPGDKVKITIQSKTNSAEREIEITLQEDKV